MNNDFGTRHGQSRLANTPKLIIIGPMKTMLWTVVGGFAAIVWLLKATHHQTRFVDRVGESVSDALGELVRRAGPSLRRGFEVVVILLFLPGMFWAFIYALMASFMLIIDPVRLWTSLTAFISHIDFTKPDLAFGVGVGYLGAEVLRKSRAAKT